MPHAAAADRLSLLRFFSQDRTDSELHHVNRTIEKIEKAKQDLQARLTGVASSVANRRHLREDVQKMNQQLRVDVELHGPLPVLKGGDAFSIEDYPDTPSASSGEIKPQVVSYLLRSVTLVTCYVTF
jgi:hypothetical protein